VAKEILVASSSRHGYHGSLALRESLNDVDFFPAEAAFT